MMPDRGGTISIKPGMINIPIGLKLALAVLVCLSVLTENPLLTVVTLLSLAVLAKLTWFRGEPPILFFVVGFQWFQVSAAVFHANLQGRVIGNYPDSPEMVQAFWLSLAGLFVLAIGMRLMVGRWSSSMSASRISIETQHYSIRKIWWLYLVLFLLANVSAGYLWSILPLRSISLALLSLRWVAYFALVYLAMVAGKGFRQPVLLVATVMEIVIGFAGFFSGFKQAMFVFTLALLASKVRLKNKDLIPVCAIVVLTLFLGVVWTAIKGDYRAFLSQGTGQQVILVPLTDRLGKAADLTLELDAADFTNAAERMLSRSAYIEMFARVLDYVPRVRNHEGGDLWMTAVKHILMPRILFPGKSALPSDSELTMQYTGMTMASGAQGTSISMGYMAESYIDFGAFFMFIPVFMLGLLWGWVYRYFVTRTLILFVGYGFATIVLMGASQFEIHTVKLLGGVLTSFIVLAFIKHFFLGRFARSFLSR